MRQLFCLAVWVLVIPLILYCGVLFLTLLALKHPQKGTVLKTMWSEVWLLGLLANLGGAMWMILVLFFWTSSFLTNHFFGLIGIVITGVCLYFVEMQAMRTGELLSVRERRIAALAVAITGAPYFFVLPYFW